MLTKEEIGRLKVMEDEANGIWAIPPKADEPTYRVRSLHQYCEVKGVQIKDLTPAELKQFEITKPTKRYIAARKAL